MPRHDTATNPLSDTLKLLADPNRLDLLQQLREPKIVDEIEMTPSRASNEANPNRQLTRQAIRHHLRQLREANLVIVSERERDDGRHVSEFKVNEQAFYDIVEKLHNLNAYIGRSSNGNTSDNYEDGWQAGPKLVLVRGLYDGQVYPLNEGHRSPPRGWVIGHGEECSVKVDYDPHVASEDAEILPRNEAPGYKLIDLRTSHHRTIVNGNPVEFGGEEALEHGDVLKVGSSVFVFHEQ